MTDKKMERMTKAELIKLVNEKEVALAEQAREKYRARGEREKLRLELRVARAECGPSKEACIEALHALDTFMVASNANAFFDHFKVILKGGL